MGSQSTTQAPEVLSYLAIRRFLGILGILLPLVLPLSGCLTGEPLRPSISDYYHSQYPLIHGFFVGSMCAIGVFLACYKGHTKKKDNHNVVDHTDNLITWTAGVAAFGVAIFPVTPSEPVCTHSVCTNMSNTIHSLSALVFFGALGYMSLIQFAKGDNKFRKYIHRGCGVIIFLAIAAVLTMKYLLNASSYIFWPEAVAVWAFGISWLVKGCSLRERAK